MEIFKKNYENDIFHSHISKKICFFVLVSLYIDYIIKEESRSVILESNDRGQPRDISIYAF